MGKVVNLHTPATDPANINGRLYRQLDLVLAGLEDPGREEKVTLKERIAALIAIARIQIAFVGMRKEKLDDPDRGASVRKYATAFTKNDTGRGKKRAGTAAKPKPGPEPDDDWFEQSGLSDDDDPDAA